MDALSCTIDLMRETHRQRVGEWSVLMEWAEGAESGGPVRLVIEPADEGSPPNGGLSSTVLRRVDFQEAATKLTPFFAMARKHNRQADSMTGKRLRQALAEGVTNDYLVQLCVAYAAIVKRGRDHPTEYLAELVGRGTSTIKGHLWQAKQDGLFVGSPGRVGGELTPEGEQIYEQVVDAAAKKSHKRRSKT